ncbi:chromosome partitioning protein ParA [Vibrio zhugei]|uniref:Chromosome partitioning protein ParA n=1 Tax=Vibrio zhugei TaxID=2479546 RepID=A0ABV7CAK5_9VIBR|nr:chromosome partitioning protein ParA [Vibrio zhugei]
MVTINGLPSSIPGPNRTSKSKKNEVRQSHNPDKAAQTTKVAHAVSQSIRHMNESDLRGATLHYDLPEGRGRKALEEYMGVMHQAKRDELAQLLGVDLYI